MEGTIIEPAPLPDERIDIEMDVGLKLDNTLLRLRACSVLLRVLKMPRCMERRAS